MCAPTPDEPLRFGRTAHQKRSFATHSCVLNARALGVGIGTHGRRHQRRHRVRLETAHARQNRARRSCVYANALKYASPSLPRRTAATAAAAEDARFQPGRQRRPNGHSLSSTRRASTHTQTHTENQLTRACTSLSSTVPARNIRNTVTTQQHSRTHTHHHIHIHTHRQPRHNAETPEQIAIQRCAVSPPSFVAVVAVVAVAPPRHTVLFTRRRQFGTRSPRQTARVCVCSVSALRRP